MARALAPANPSWRRLSIAASTSAWRVACAPAPAFVTGRLARPAFAMSAPIDPLVTVLDRLLKSYAQGMHGAESGLVAAPRWVESARTISSTHGELGQAGLRG